MPGPKPGTVWRGRMLSRSISESKKLAGVSERSALVYLLLLPRHAPDGTVPCDDVSMLVGTARFAIAHGWTAEDMSSVRNELAASGLWEVQGDDALYVGWQNHQRLDRVTPIYDTTPRNSATTPHNSVVTPRISAIEEKGSRREVEEKGIEVVGWTVTEDGEEESRIRSAWARAFEAVTGTPATLCPKDVQAAREAATLRTCEAFPDLEKEFVRTLKGLKAKGYRLSVSACVNNVGGEWPEAKNGKRPPKPKKPGDPFGADPITNRPYHPGA